MIALLQRVSRAEVKLGGERLGAIDRGILALVCAEPGDDESTAERMLERLLGYRVFPDGAGKMNLSVEDVRGGLLLVPQFTLAADTSKGMRPSFSSALFQHRVRPLRRAYAGRLGERRPCDVLAARRVLTTEHLQGSEFSSVFG